MTLLHKHKINGGFLAPDRIPMEERNKNEMILELQNEVHIKDKEIERLNKELEFEKLKNKEVREYIEEKIKLYTVDLTEKNKNKLSYTAPIRAVYKELLEILDKVEE